MKMATKKTLKIHFQFQDKNINNKEKKHEYIQEKLLEDEYGKGIHRYVMRKKLF